jgi:hypothetical protein
MSVRSFTVQILINAKNNAKNAFGNFKQGFSDALTIPTTLADAWKGLGGILGNVVNQLPQVAAELLNLGVEAETATNRFEKFAGSPERAAELLAAFNEGAGGAVDRMTAMSKSAKLLQLGLADNAGEMEKLARMAINLGDQTMDAGSRIDDFSALLANQSIPRLDNFGISSGRVRQRIKELQESGQAIGRDQAFKMAVMEEGAKAIEKLGDTSELTSVKLDRSKAAIQDLKVDAGSALLSLAQSIDILGLNLDTLPGRIRGITDVLAVGGQALKLYGMLTKEVDGNILNLGKAWDTVQIKAAAASGAFGDGTREMQRYQNALDGINPEVERYGVTIAQVAVEQESMGFATNEATAAYEQFIGVAVTATDTASAMESVFAAVTGTTMEQAEASREAFKAQQEAAEAARVEMQQTAQFAFSAALQFTQFNKRAEESAENFAEQRERLELEHQKKMAEFTKRGQSRAVQLNVAAEQEKLAALQQRLDMALLQQSEFTEKTKESTRVRKDQQIAALQEEIASQEQLLDDFHSGRLITAGENVTALVEQENLAHEQRVADLEEAQKEQEELQRQSLGRMILQSFEAWAAMRGIPAEEMLKMRTAIAEEFGLVEKGSQQKIAIMIEGWNTWAAAVGTNVADANATMASIATAIDKIPSVKEIEIRISSILTGSDAAREAGREELEQRGGVAAISQLGSSFARGGITLVGEEGPELVNLPVGASVMPTSAITNNFNMTVNTRATQPTVIQDFETMRAIAG